MDWMPPWLRANVSTRHSFMRPWLLWVAIPWLVMVESPHFSGAFNAKSLNLCDLQGNAWVKMCTEQGSGSMFRSWLSCCRIDRRGRNYWTSPADRSCMLLTLKVIVQEELHSRNRRQSAWNKCGQSWLSEEPETARWSAGLRKASF